MQAETGQAPAISDGRWEALCENFPLGLAIVDFEGRYQATNARFRSMLGYSEEQLRSQLLTDLTGEPQGSSTAALAGLASRERDSLTFEKYYPRQDGALVCLNVYVSFVPATTKTPQFLSVVLEDVTERRNTELGTQVAVAVENAERLRRLNESRKRLAGESLSLEDELRLERDFEQLVGQSLGLKHVLEQVRTVAATDTAVLILGETGTGKELIARLIHKLSSRRNHALVRADCAAIPAGLLESELFGHEKGAFTGAVARNLGRIELANKGTLFLDEVGDIPLELQSKLLRVLQEREFERLGSTRTIRADFRLVAATHRDLLRMVEHGQFRRDLYYRLNVFPIRIPPLRERADDIPLLAWHFVRHYARRMNRQIDKIRPEDMNRLTRHTWPGNIRELQNIIERSVVESTTGVLELAPFPELARRPHDQPSADIRTLAAAEREHILNALRDTDWVIAGPHGAAQRLGVRRTTLLYKMRRLGITRPQK